MPITTRIDCGHCGELINIDDLVLEERPDYMREGPPLQRCPECHGDLTPRDWVVVVNFTIPARTSVDAVDALNVDADINHEVIETWANRVLTEGDI